MSNIYQHNFNNCFDLRLSNSDYWDLFLCYDCQDPIDPNPILSGSCLLINFDINDNNCWSGNTLYNLVDWTGATINPSGVTLNDIGLTGIDNGFISYNCDTPTSGNTFLSAFTGSSLVLTSGDTRFFMNGVSGCTYDYTINNLSGNTEGRFSRLCGGFYQGFFKLSDKTYFDEISDNKFVWPLDWFNCPPSCSTITTSGCSCNHCSSGSTANCLNPDLAYQCYMDKKPIPYDYQVLPTRYDRGWTSMFWLRKDDDIFCSGNTATTLNDVYSGNSGFFFYMGTRAENKFWDLFSGETGYTTSSGYPLSPPIETKKILLDNPFSVYQPGGTCCFTGVTEQTIQQKDRNADIVNNALGFRIKSDGSIGYRTLGYSGVCTTVTATTVVNCDGQCSCECNSTGETTVTYVEERYVTGVTVTEQYSEPNLVYNNEWIHVSIRFTAYEEYEGCELNGVPRRKGRLDIYLNGYLKWSVHNFEEFLFEELDEHREKQEGVPFNYSWGGGTQGLIETNTVNGPDVNDDNLVIQNNFAGTFNGDVSIFKLYGCSLDVTTIRDDFRINKDRFGLTNYVPVVIPNEVVDVTIDLVVDSGSTILDYTITVDKVLDVDYDLEFVTWIEYRNHGMMGIDVQVTIPSNTKRVFLTKILDYDYSDLVDVSNFDSFKTNTNIDANLNFTFNSSKTKVNYMKELTPINSGGDDNNNIVYYGKIPTQQYNVNNISTLTTIERNSILESHIRYDDTPGYCYLLVPIKMSQPVSMRNSEDGCNGFTIPFIPLGVEEIIRNNETLKYNVYRSFVSTHSSVDVWICD